MGIKFEKVVGRAIIICFFVGTGFYKTFALKCYTCDGYEACEKEKLGKSGSLGIDKYGDKQDYGISQCHAAESDYKDSEFCTAIRGSGGVWLRGCAAVSKSEIWDPSKVSSECPQFVASINSEEEGRRACPCYNDLCNGDPLSCCESPILDPKSTEDEDAIES